MRVDARQARCPPRGRLMPRFPPPSLNPRLPSLPARLPLPPAPERPARPAWAAPAPTRPRPARGAPGDVFLSTRARWRRSPLPSTGVDAGRSGSAGDGGVGSAPPAAASHPWTGGAGRGLARRGRRRASGAGLPEGTCPRDVVWVPVVAGAGSRCALPGEGQGAPPRRTQAVRALQDPKASRASAGAVRARPAGRFTRPGRGPAPGQPGEGLPERFARAGPPSRRRGAGR